MDQDLWQNILNELEGKISESGFATWFRDTFLIDIDKNELIIKAESKFNAEYLTMNYAEMVSEIASTLYNKKYNIKFIYQNNNIETQNQQKIISINPQLNSRYTFNNFVVGNSNNLAHSAAMAVADSPGTTYNPLFIYGESGMGKTHLMQAIGHYVHSSFRNYKVFYITTEQFTNEMIDSIRSNTTQQFRNKFRNMDLLLLDDVHFLSKKEGTQEEFFHTFNALYENKKQIVLTSDKPLKEIADLEKRLVSRFSWGLTVDLKNPDFETRVAILKKKSIYEELHIGDDIIEFIAENISSNIRALEGSLIRIAAYASYNKINIENLTVHTTKDILSDIITITPLDITMDNIFQKICKFYNITPSQLLDISKKANIAFPRQVAMYLSKVLVQSVSLKDIATYYRRKDHTTALHAYNMISKKFKEDNNFRIQIESLIKEIKGFY